MAKNTLAAGQKAPEFRLETSTGGWLSLDEILASGPALFIFYKVTCPTCQLALPYLQRLEGGSFQVFTICQNDADQAREFDRTFGIHLPALLDNASAGYPVSNAFGIAFVPSLFLVERDRTISEVIIAFDKAGYEKLAARAGRPVFEAADRVPAYKPG